MKRLIKTSLVIIVILLTSISCEKDESSSGPEGSYLTINGDTRELKNSSNDSDLRIDFIAKTHLKNGWYGMDEDVKMISVDIYDPNHSLISNFGNYGFSGHYLTVTFLLPMDFDAGQYTTKSDRVVPIGNATIGKFFIQQKLNWTSDSGHNITIKDEGNRYVLEFKNVNFDDGKAELSGRIIANKL